MKKESTVGNNDNIEEPQDIVRTIGITPNMRMFDVHLAHFYNSLVHEAPNDWMRFVQFDVFKTEMYKLLTAYSHVAYNEYLASSFRSDSPTKIKITLGEKYSKLPSYLVELFRETCRPMYLGSADNNRLVVPYFPLDAKFGYTPTTGLGITSKTRQVVSLIETLASVRHVEMMYLFESPSAKSPFYVCTGTKIFYINGSGVPAYRLEAMRVLRHVDATCQLVGSDHPRIPNAGDEPPEHPLTLGECDPAVIQERPFRRPANDRIGNDAANNFQVAKSVRFSCDFTQLNRMTVDQPEGFVDGFGDVSNMELLNVVKTMRIDDDENKRLFIRNYIRISGTGFSHPVLLPQLSAHFPPVNASPLPPSDRRGATKVKRDKFRKTKGKKKKSTRGRKGNNNVPTESKSDDRSGDEEEG